MAEYLSRGSLDSESSLWLRDAVLSDRIPAKQSEAARELSPYLYGHAFWAYLGQRFGDDVVEKALKPGKQAAPAEGSHALRDRRGARGAV